MEEDLEVIILEISLFMEEEEENIMMEVLNLAARVGSRCGYGNCESGDNGSGIYNDFGNDNHQLSNSTFQCRTLVLKTKHFTYFKDMETFRR